ncbi:MAG TPA: hypothetical protein VI756_21185 [Blastocatellia bacterium]
MEALRSEPELTKTAAGTDASPGRMSGQCVSRAKLRHMSDVKSTVYVETSIISYVTARFSRDLITAAHQEISQEWWTGSRVSFDLFIS